MPEIQYLPGPKGGGQVNWGETIIAPAVDAWIDKKKYESKREEEDTRQAMIASINKGYMAPNMKDTRWGMRGMRPPSQEEIMASSGVTPMDRMKDVLGIAKDQASLDKSEREAYMQNLVLDSIKEKIARGEKVDPFWLTQLGTQASFTTSDTKKKGGGLGSMVKNFFTPPAQPPAQQAPLSPAQQQMFVVAKKKFPQATDQQIMEWMQQEGI